MNDDLQIDKTLLKCVPLNSSMKKNSFSMIQMIFPNFVMTLSDEKL